MSDELDPKVAEELFSRLKRPGDVFVQNLNRDHLILAPGVYDAMGAWIGAQQGFNAIYGSGWAKSVMGRRQPDMGFHDRTEIVNKAKYIIRASYPLPVIMDAEAGFGTEVTLTETVREYDEAGVSVAHIEDQLGTRRCGNLSGKVCISADEMVAKIKSWLVASYHLGTSMRLMVRTDSLTAMDGGIDQAIERMKRYMDVDYQGLRPLISWADALIDPHDIEKWTTELLKHDPDMILGFNYSPNKDWTGYYHENFRQKPPTYDQLHNRGFRLIFHTILEARAAMEAIWNTFADMRRRNEHALWDLHERQRNHPVGDAQATGGVKAWEAYEKFIGGQATLDRFNKSKGYGKP